MASVTLVHPESRVTVPVRLAINKCSLFENTPALTASPYRVQSPVSLSIFQEFISSLEGKAITITTANFTGLQLLCDEFGFSEIAAKLSEFRSSSDLNKPEDSNTLPRIAFLEETLHQHSQLIAILQNEFRQLSTDFGRLVSEVSALKAQIPSTVIQSQSRPPPSPSSSVPSFDSRIVSNFPEIFAEFRRKHFKILWRGSRDGFKVREFHGRCDGHANTLTVILDTKGNIFGEFTPVRWESRTKSPYEKADESLKSFLFTLKNPNKIPARKFALKADRKHWAIYCGMERGPCFSDIGVFDNCNANTENYTHVFGTAYHNDTGMEREKVFTGTQYFQVAEIEVFEITD
jgi:hypothetical protein